jgi:hypothetical protein
MNTSEKRQIHRADRVTVSILVGISLRHKRSLSSISEERWAMNSEANKQAAIAAWQAFRTRDPERIAAGFTEDAEWLAPANNATAVALNGPWHIVGRDQIARMFATEVRKLFVADLAAEFRGFYADGNIVVIENRLRAKLANGNAYDNDYCFVLELENGLIRRVREYMDTAKANRLVFGAEASEERQMCRHD